MAKPVSEEELQLKKRARRRLIGAIALVAAVAAVLPMVLDSEPKPTSQEVSIQIPPPAVKGVVAPAPGAATKAPAAAKSEIKAEPKGETRAEGKSDAKVPTAAPVTAMSAPTPAPPEKAAETAPAKAAETPAAKAAETPPAKAAETPPAKAVAKPPSPVAAGTPDPALAKAIERITERGSDTSGEKKASAKAAEKGADKAPAAEKTATAKAVPGSFFIQVMALADSDKAKQSQKKIADGGVRAYTETVTAGGNKVTRVRAGPFATREEAEKAQARLQGMGYEGKVAAY